jgi:hypothetical protein
VLNDRDEVIHGPDGRLTVRQVADFLARIVAAGGGDATLVYTREEVRLYGLTWRSDAATIAAHTRHYDWPAGLPVPGVVEVY